MATLLPRHLDDLRISGLSDETIEALGFYSGDATQVELILGFGVGAGLVLPYPTVGEQESFARVKPDDPPVIDGKRPKYLSPKGGGLRAYIPFDMWDALKVPTTRIAFTEGEKKAAKADQEESPASVWAECMRSETESTRSCLSWRR